MKKLGEIRMTQGRVLIGENQDGKTDFVVFELVGGLYQGQPGIVTRIDYENEWAPSGCEAVGFYEVTHPVIVSGPWCDFVADVVNVVRRRLIDDSIAKRADSYQNFAAQGYTDEPVL